MAQNRMIWIYKEDRLWEMPSMTDALELKHGCPVISAAGAGGKTTTLHRLAEEFVRQGQRVIVTTTTHIIEEDEPCFLRAVPEGSAPAALPQMQADAQAFSDLVRDRLDRFGQVWTGMPASGGKLSSLPALFLDQLWDQEIPVLIEADGARRMPLKVPAAHEPVIHPRTTHVLSVYGLDAVGKMLKDVCFREELAERLLNKNRTERVTAEDIALLASSAEAGRKGCPEQAAYTVVLNKADTDKRREDALAICRELQDRGCGRVIITSVVTSGAGRMQDREL